MTDFDAWFANVEKDAADDPRGQEFQSNNFSVQHMGGGCLAWQRHVDDHSWVLITDMGGTDLFPDENAADELERGYIVGYYWNDGDDWDDCKHASTVTEAIAIADSIQS